jgi:hypothetical protein
MTAFARFIHGPFLMVEQCKTKERSVANLVEQLLLAVVGHHSQLVANVIF